MYNKHIAFNHTGIQALKYKQELLKRFSGVIDSGIFLNGTQVSSFEQKLTSYLGKYCLTCASGHDALLLAIRSLSLSHTDEVLYPVNAYPTAFPVYLAGVKGVPVDVDENGQISPQDLFKKITGKTKAVIIVHLYGLVGQLDKIFPPLKKKKIFIIEDCAQAFGTTYKDKLVGTLGDIGCFSFYPTKNIGTLGDGGAIWTRHEKIYKYLIKARSYGATTRYKSDFLSGHSRLPELQAAVLNLYFNTFQKETEKRRKIFLIYRQEFEKGNLKQNISHFFSHPRSDPVMHLFTIKTKKRNELQKYLKKKGIETHIHYPYPVHMVPAFSFLKFKKHSFPVAEKLTKQIISLPFHQHLKRYEVFYIVNEIKRFYE